MRRRELLPYVKCAQAVLDRTTDEESNVLALAKLEAAVKNGADTSVELAFRRSDHYATLKPSPLHFA